MIIGPISLNCTCDLSRQLLQNRENSSLEILKLSIQTAYPSFVLELFPKSLGNMIIEQIERMKVRQPPGQF